VQSHDLYPRGASLLGGMRVTVVLAVLVLLAFIIAVAFGPWLVDFDPVRTRTPDRLKPPFATLRDGSIALMGTDAVGRDIFAQVVLGARVSFVVGVSAAAFAAAFGALVGIVAGWYGGRLEAVLMRIVDIQLAFPSILIAVFLAAFVAPSMLSVILILAISRWAVVARLARAVVQRCRARSYVEIAIISGEHPLRIIRRAILPALWVPLLILMTAELSLIILAEAALSFLGLGTPPDVPSWGRLIASGRNYLGSAWWIATLPGLVIVALIISIGVVGDALQARLGARVRHAV